MKDQEIEWIDTHCHLDMLDGLVEDQLAESQKYGVSRCITIGTNQESNPHVLQITSDHDNVWGSLGFHPHHAAECEKKQIVWLEESCKANPKILAIGECGLDFYYNKASVEAQRAAFIQQMELAIELNLPVIIHTREAEQETMDLMKPFFREGLRALFHSFTSTLELARFALDQNAYIAFNGICTFKKAENVREVIRYMPLDKILLETDAPFLTPEPHRGKQNIPGYCSFTGAYIAKMRNIFVPEFAQQMVQNTEAMFPDIFATPPTKPARE